MSESDHLSTTSTLHAFVQRYPRLFVLTGAGASTESGIPGYRDAEGRWARPAPVYFHEFIHLESARLRYWSRSMAGWPKLAAARPNAAHFALARLEVSGHVLQLVTQNVDGLHRRAGSPSTIELHGNAHFVTCLDCAARSSRASIQQTLEAENPSFIARLASTRADGDAEPDCDDAASFRIPRCTRCGGILKPDVVFFGERVPGDRVDAARAALERADAMLAVGSSLMVYSGFRFCEWAAGSRKPIAAINLGVTRADPLLSLKVSEPCGQALWTLAERLKGRTKPRPCPSS